VLVSIGLTGRPRDEPAPLPRGSKVVRIPLMPVHILHGWDAEALQRTPRNVAFVTFDLRSFRRDTTELSARIIIAFPRRWLPQIRSTRTGRPVAHLRRGVWDLSPRYEHVKMLFIIRSSDPDKSYLQRIPLAEMYRRPDVSDAVRRIRVAYYRRLDIELVGSPSKFPDDSYTMKGQAGVFLTGPVALRYGSETHHVMTRVLPLALLASRSPALRDLSVHMGSVGPLDTSFAIKAHTPRSRRVMTYILACAPLLLLLAALWFALTGPPAPSWETMLPLGLGLFAVPSIRAVLVPSDAAGLTRLDWLLLTEVVGVVIVIFTTVWRSVRQRRPRRLPS
jgi:hypothetical protein